MSLPKRQSVTRRGFLATMAATGAAVGAFALSTHGASAASLVDTAPESALGSSSRAANDDAARATSTKTSPGANVMLDQMAPARAQGTAIRPFVVEFPDAKYDDLRQRINAMVWPDRELVADATQGVQLATMQSLARYWCGDYNLRSMETKVNALPNFKTEIDGVDIHFIHVRSQHENALPVIITHGWPGSVVEQLKIIDRLTNPTAYGAGASDAFDVVIPSLPGHGFSGTPAVLGWDPIRIASAWATLMNRLGYSRYVAQGGDWGNAITEQLALQTPAGLLGIHTNMPATIPDDIAKALATGGAAPAGLNADEQRAYGQLDFFYKKGLGYANEMALRPQTLYAIMDSPVGMAAWMLDHDAAAYDLISRIFAGEVQSGGLTRDDILDNITLYWLTNTSISAARLYWESKLSFFAPKDVPLPTGVTAFPDEIYTAPESWTRKAYPNLIYFNKAERGGHFAAWEQPEILSNELRATFRSLR